MSINIFNPNKASCSSKVPGFSSVATKAGSLVDKVLKLFMAIILALVSAVKYSKDLITSSFKEVKPSTTIEKLDFAAISRIKKAVENQSTIIKVVIAAAAVTGAVYAYRSYNIETQTQPKGSGALVKALAIGGLGIGGLGIVKYLNYDPDTDMLKKLIAGDVNSSTSNEVLKDIFKSCFALVSTKENFL